MDIKQIYNHMKKKKIVVEPSKVEDMVFIQITQIENHYSSMTITERQQRGSAVLLYPDHLLQLHYKDTVYVGKTPRSKKEVGYLITNELPELKANPVLKQIAKEIEKLGLNKPVMLTQIAASRKEFGLKSGVRNQLFQHFLTQTKKEKKYATIVTAVFSQHDVNFYLKKNFTVQHGYTDSFGNQVSILTKEISKK